MRPLKHYLPMALTLIVVSCGVTETAEELWSRAEREVTARQYERSIKSLKVLVKTYPTHTVASKAQFRIGDIYLNNTRDIPAALEALRSTIDRYPQTDEGVKALFMLGFVYANHLADYPAAQQAYLQFIDHYPNHELIPSVEFELENMGKPMDDIDVLKDVVNAS